MIKKINGLTINKKISLIIFLSIILLVFIGVPTLCNIIMNNKDNVYSVWDGTTSETFNSGSGALTNPYKITNGSELSLLTTYCNEENNYCNNLYFELSNDIYLNSGVLEYNNNTINYIKNNKKYFIKPNTNEYYSTLDYSELVGNVNILNSIDNFNGTLNGNNYHIYGLYISNNNLSTYLFNNVSGTIKDIKIENSLIYGGNYTSLINNLDNGTVSNLSYTGTIKNNGVPTIADNTTSVGISFINKEKVIEINRPELPDDVIISKMRIYGAYDMLLSNKSLVIDGHEFNEGSFEVIYEQFISSIKITTNGYALCTIDDIHYEITYNNDSSSLIYNSNNSTIDKVVVKGYIESTTHASGIVNRLTNTTISNSYNLSNVNSIRNANGLSSTIYNSNITNVYNKGNITSTYNASGLLNKIFDSNSNITNTFNVGNINAETTSNILLDLNSQTITNANNYYVNNLTNDNIGTQTTKENLLNTNFLTNTLNYTTELYDLKNNEVPYLISNDNTSPTLEIKINDKVYNNEQAITKYTIYDRTNLNITYNDEKSDILKLEYYINRNNTLNKLDFNNIEWNLYDEELLINEPGYYTYYFKITDTSNNIKYVNTDLIILDGYDLTITDELDNKLDSYNNQITNDSKIKYTYTKNLKINSTLYDNYKYVLTSDNLIPENTIIKLIDYNNSKIYKYVLDTSSNIIDLNNFKELGITNEVLFNNIPNNYHNGVGYKEKFMFIFDFKNTSITSNLTLNIDLQIIDENNNIISKTLNEFNKTTNIIKYNVDNEELKTTLNLSTTFNDYLDFSSLNEKEIEITNKISTTILNETNIYNSNLLGTKTYLNIRLTDSNNNTLKGNIINAISFDIDNIKYYATEDGIIKIPLSNDLNDITKIITISTEHIINEILNGTYYIKMYTNISNIKSEDIIIPVSIKNETILTNYKYKVELDNNDRVILYNEGVTLNNSNEIPINILYEGILSKPNIKISLEKKLSHNAYNQVYELVDLNSHLKSKLNTTNISNKYNLISDLKVRQDNEVILKLDVNKWSLGGYKLVFDLYDEDAFVGSIEKTIIIK